MSEMPSVAIGIVKSCKDDAGEGRIELEFPWLPDKHRSAMASIASPLAGKDRGLYFMPEENDEVLCAFDQGDFDHPYIVGFLWNGVDKPPRDKTSTRVLVTPGNHMLEFEDDESEKKITVQSSGEHQIVIDDVANTITVKTKNGPQIVLSDSPSSIKLTGGGRSVALENSQVTIS